MDTKLCLYFICNIAVGILFAAPYNNILSYLLEDSDDPRGNQ